VAPTLAELAEDTISYLLPSPTFEPLERDGYVYVAGPRAAWIARIRRVDVPAVRAEAEERGAKRVEWWLGPSSPPGADELLEAAGLEPGPAPRLTGMTCVAAPPPAPGIDVRPAEPEELVALEQAVWGGEPNPPLPASPVERHYVAILEGRPVGGARAVDTAAAVALMGGVVLPEARRRGVYRALVRARWDDAVARGTPCLVVQAGAMSAPILATLGFVRQCDLRLFVDPGVASSHGHN
jgi:GNAT superfamily N-acetyltransferase